MKTRERMRSPETLDAVAAGVMREKQLGGSPGAATHPLAGHMQLVDHQLDSIELYA